MAVTDIDEVLDVIGFGKLQVLILFISGLIGTYLIDEMLGVGVVSISIACEFGMSEGDLTMLSSSAYLGLVVSSHYMGYKTDQIGRRKLTLYSLGLSLLVSFVSIMMPEFYSFLVARFILGVCVSGCGLNYITYVSEFTKIAWRSAVVNCTSYCIAVASVYVPVIAMTLEPLNRTAFVVGNTSVRYWRISMLLNTLPGVIAFCVLWVLPESAKFHISVGRPDLAYETLDKLCRVNHKKRLIDFGITDVSQPRTRLSFEEKPNFFARLWDDTRPLFRAPYVRPFVHVTAMLCGFFFVGNCMSIWFTKLRDLADDSNRSICQMISTNRISQAMAQKCLHEKIPYMDVVILGISFLTVCIFITVMLCCVHRSIILLINASAAGVCGLGLLLVTHKVPVLGGMMYLTSFGTASIPLVVTVMVDSVPTHMRGKAVSLMFMCARLAVIIGNLVIGLLIWHYCMVVFGIFAAYYFAIAILSYYSRKLPVVG